MTHDLRAITLVLASQRSGSSLLCRDIESLGGMGAPREYFLNILGKNAREGLGEQDVLMQIAQGVLPVDPGIGAVKLMVNYAPQIDAYIRQTQPVGHLQALQNIIDWACGRFDRVNLIALVRINALDQAISRAMAQLTDVWHRKAELEAHADPYVGHKLEPRRVNMAILEALPGVIRQTEILQRIAARNAQICMMLDYDMLSGSIEESSRQIVGHARKAGFTPRSAVATRRMRKLLNDDRTVEIKAQFKSFLEDPLQLR